MRDAGHRVQFNRPGQRRSLGARALLTAVVLLVPMTVLAQSVPDPLPPYQSLPRVTMQLIHFVDDVIGKRLVLENDVGQDIEYFVWDVGLARLDDGRIVLSRAALQSEQGLHVLPYGPADLPPGAEELHVLSQVDANRLWYLDELGAVRRAHAYEF